MTHRNCRHHQSDNSGMGCIVALVLGVIALPLVGLWMALTGKESDQQALGIILTIIGIIIWIAIAANS